jgi:hypothetical protein
LNYLMDMIHSPSMSRLLGGVAFALLSVVSLQSVVKAQVAPTLGVAGGFGVLAHSAVTGSTGTGTVVNGHVGSYPTPTVSNFPPSTVGAGFTLYTTVDIAVQQAQIAGATAFDFVAVQGGSVLNDNLATVGVLGPGIYALDAADLPSSSVLTLNGEGVFLFNVASSLTMNTSSVVSGSADPCNVFWRVGSSATLNGTQFMGTVLAHSSITLDGGDVLGRLLGGLGGNGAVTMSGSGGNTIGGCAITPVPTMPEMFMVLLAVVLGTLSYVQLSRGRMNPALQPRS